MSSLEFAHPEYFWLFLLIPIVLYLKKKFYKHGGVQFSDIKAIKTVAKNKKNYKTIILNCLRNVTICLLIISAARPRVNNIFEDEITSGIDIVLAVDVSSSMLAVDLWQNNYTKTRLDVAKDVINEFIKNRKHDRIGLIAFAGNPYLVSPLTMNHDWLRQNLSNVRVGLIEDGTAIGSAITMCTNRLKDVDRKSKIVVLLTDGCNNRGDISPKIAAEVAKTFNVKFYTIGIGKDGNVPVLQADSNGNIIKDKYNKPFVQYANIPVDIEMLKEVAQITNGESFRATTENDLSKIYSYIDKLERHDVIVKSYSEYNEYFKYFLYLACVSLLLELVLSNTKFIRIP